MVMAERTALGERLAMLRRLRNLTQVELGQRVGVSNKTISNWELGVSHIPSAEVSLVAEALGVTVAGLFNDDYSQVLGGRDTKGLRSRPSADGPQAGDGLGSSDRYNASPLEEARRGVKPLPIYRWGALGDPRDRESSPHPDREEY